MKDPEWIDHGWIRFRAVDGHVEIEMGDGYYLAIVNQARELARELAAETEKAERQRDQAEEETE